MILCYVKVKGRVAGRGKEGRYGWKKERESNSYIQTLVSLLTWLRLKVVEVVRLIGASYVCQGGGGGGDAVVMVVVVVMMMIHNNNNDE